MQKIKLSIFTLIELLLVISIIAMLTCLLLPGLSLAKARSKQIACAGNLRQLGLKLAMYSNDNNMTLPPASYSGVIWEVTLLQTENKTWSQRDQVWKCPIFADKDYYCYGINVGITAVVAPPPAGYYSGKVEKIPNPGKIVLLADSVHYLPGSYPDSPLYTGAAFIIEGPYEHGGIGTVDRQRHSKGANSFFADGHFECRKWNEIPILSSDPYWDGTVP